MRFFYATNIKMATKMKETLKISTVPLSVFVY